MARWNRIILISAVVCLTPLSLWSSPKRIGHPVRIVSMCFGQRSRNVEDIAQRIELEGQKGVDLICLPEAWTGMEPETMEGSTLKVISDLAKKHRTYIVCPLILQRGGHKYNSSILINRQGKVAGVYDKIFPYWSEFEGKNPVRPAQKDAVVVETDFGRLGLAICFDAKFPEVFQRLREKGADLVVWSSAYSGYTELQAFSLLHHYYIVTSTWTGDCVVYDITGRNLLDKNDQTGMTVVRFELDLDRQIYHYNFNFAKREKLLAEHTEEVRVENDMPREEWFVLKAVKPGISARDLANQYGIETLRDYKDRSRRSINERRGFDFYRKYGGNEKKH